MPRTLPWLSGGSGGGGGSISSPQSLLATRRPAKRPRTDLGNAVSPSLPRVKANTSVSKVTGLPSPSVASETQQDANSDVPEPVVLEEQARAGQARARTPSTSPPPFDPPDVEYMREGLDADDIWVMVEDEFYDMAKTFTAHLHRAEYERQRQLARDRNAGIHDGGSSSISRPVDGMTELGKDKAREKERQRQERDQKGRVSRALGGASTASEGESSDTEKDSDHDLTPRAAISKSKKATSLQGLMISPSKTHKSLMGIQGPILKTRAAAGYTQAQNTPSSSRTVDRLAELARKRSKHAAEEEGESTTASEDEDDLDATPTRWSYSASRTTISSPINTTPPKRSPSISKDTPRANPSTRGPAKLLSRSASVRFEGIDSDVGERFSPLGDDAESDLAFDGFLRPTPLPNPRSRAGSSNVSQRLL